MMSVSLSWGMMKMSMFLMETTRMMKRNSKRTKTRTWLTGMI